MRSPVGGGKYDIIGDLPAGAGSIRWPGPAIGTWSRRSWRPGTLSGTIGNWPRASNVRFLQARAWTRVIVHRDDGTEAIDGSEAGIPELRALSLLPERRRRASRPCSASSRDVQRHRGLPRSRCWTRIDHSVWGRVGASAPAVLEASAASPCTSPDRSRLDRPAGFGDRRPAQASAIPHRPGVGSRARPRRTVRPGRLRPRAGEGLEERPAGRAQGVGDQRPTGRYQDGADAKAATSSPFGPVHRVTRSPHSTSATAASACSAIEPSPSSTTSVVTGVPLRAPHRGTGSPRGDPDLRRRRRRPRSAGRRWARTGTGQATEAGRRVDGGGPAWRWHAVEAGHVQASDEAVDEPRRRATTPRAGRPPRPASRRCRPGRTESLRRGARRRDQGGACAGQAERRLDEGQRGQRPPATRPAAPGCRVRAAGRGTRRNRLGLGRIEDAVQVGQVRPGAREPASACGRRGSCQDPQRLAAMDATWMR